MSNMSAKVARLVDVNSVGKADWGSLQIDVICIIIRKLDIPDYIRFRAVCTSWNHVCRDVSNHPRIDPWLMLSENPLSGSKFFSIPERKNQIIKIRSNTTIFGSMWDPVGSSHGWLIYFSSFHGTMQLVNPISGAQFDLPPVGRSPFSKARLLDMNESNFTVAVIYGDMKGYKVTRKGSNNWSFVESKHRLVDLVKHRRQLYTVDVYGTVEVWSEPRRVWPDQFVDTTQDLFHSPQRPSSLVETPAGDLIRVKRQSQNEFVLWILDKETSSFERTNDIGEFGLFVSPGNSFCFPAKNHPNLKANCVYFIDAYSNLCAFNLEPGTKELVESLDSERQDVRSRQCFLWFTPSLK